MNSSPPSVDIICGSLIAKLYPGELASGSSRCISFGSGRVFFIPCDFERRAGRGASRNWKKTIRYKGKPLINYLENVILADRKRGVRFVDQLYLTPSVSSSQSTGPIAGSDSTSSPTRSQLIPTTEPPTPGSPVVKSENPVFTGSPVTSPAIHVITASPISSTHSVSKNPAMITSHPAPFITESPVTRLTVDVITASPITSTHSISEIPATTALPDSHATLTHSVSENPPITGSPVAPFTTKSPVTPTACSVTPAWSASKNPTTDCPAALMPQCVLSQQAL